MGDIKDSIMVVELTSWKYFHDFISQKMLNYSHYVWRGQRDAEWGLVSSFDRETRTSLSAPRATVALEHLERFKLAIRGRRGPHPASFSEVDDWWALGQHNSLATPLLDWTDSPFVALYFAYAKPSRPSGGKRAVWALGAFDRKNAEIIASHSGDDEPPTLNFVRPHLDESARLVSQAGLFTRAPLGISVDQWVRKNFSGVTKGACLVKLVLPELGRTECLRTLNRMNINHLTLFPDIYGAAQHCNTRLRIDKY
jgi:hypothetical protein